MVRVQKVTIKGRPVFSITLPNDVIDKLNLDKGDEVDFKLIKFELNEDGTTKSVKYEFIKL